MRILFFRMLGYVLVALTVAGFAVALVLALAIRMDRDSPSWSLALSMGVGVVSFVGSLYSLTFGTMPKEEVALPQEGSPKAPLL